MLHVTNGTSVSLAEAGMTGEIVYWNDVLHEGPVPPLPLDELTQIRAGFIAALSGEREDEVRRDFEARDNSLKAFRDHEEVVLWFEHDLYDQLQLVQILDFLGSQARGSTRISLVQSGTYLGPMTPRELATLFPSRQPVTEDQFNLARAAWEAFRAPEPCGCASFEASYGLPHLGPALRRHLQQFPSTRNGLNRTEQQILDSIGDGASTIGEAFAASHEEPRFMGDTPYAAYVRHLSACRNPLVEALESGTLMDTPVRLTVTGRRVLKGVSDHIDLNGIDRWLGGVHLTIPGRVWRWNGAEVVAS